MKSLMLSLAASLLAFNAQAASVSIKNRPLGELPNGTKIVLTQPLSIPANTSKIPAGYLAYRYVDNDGDENQVTSSCVFVFEPKSVDRLLVIPSSGERVFDYKFSEADFTESVVLLENEIPVVTITCSAVLNDSQTEYSHPYLDSEILEEAGVKVILPPVVEI